MVQIVFTSVSILTVLMLDLFRELAGPEPGGFMPREALYILGKIVQRAPICGLEVVEVSPPYDISDITSLMATRVICDTMGHLIKSGQLPRKDKPAYIEMEARQESIVDWS